MLILLDLMRHLIRSVWDNHSGGWDWLGSLNRRSSLLISKQILAMQKSGIFKLSRIQQNTLLTNPFIGLWTQIALGTSSSLLFSTERLGDKNGLRNKLMLVHPVCIFTVPMMDSLYVESTSNLFLLS